MRGSFTSVVCTIYLVGMFAISQAMPLEERISVVVFDGVDQPVSRAQLESELSIELAKIGYKNFDSFSVAISRLKSGHRPTVDTSPFAKAKQIMDEAWLSYLEGRASFAANRLTEARNLATTVAHLQGGAALVAEISLRLGVTKLELNRLAEASDDFRFAHALAPERVVDDNEFKPEIVESFASAVANVSATQIRPISLNPSHGQLFVDGKPIAQGDVELGDGLHLVTAQAVGNVSSAQIVSVSVGTAAPIQIELKVDSQAASVLRGREALPLGEEAEKARQAMQSVLLYSGGDSILLVASVWRLQQPALLGQYCTGIPVQCSSVVEIGYSEGGRLAAIRQMLKQISKRARRQPPSLQSDVRILAGEKRPRKKMPASRPLWKNRWLWLGVATVSVAGTAAYLLRGEDSIRPLFSGNRCDFSSCE